MDIVERLMCQIETGPDVEDIVFINPDGPEAADEIERLREENKELKFESDFLEELNIKRSKTAIELYEENKRLRGALMEIANYQKHGWIDGITDIARAALKGDE